MPDFRLPSPDFYYAAAARAGRVALLLIGAFILVRITNRAIRTLRGPLLSGMVRRAPHPAAELEKRAATAAEIVRKTAAVAIWAAALVMALNEVGFNIGPLLAGAGIVGLAIGFGAQSLVRDVITGLFMLIENQIRIGDVVVVNGTQGCVEELNLRTTVLRGLDGTVHIFHNGAIGTLSNMTREYSYFLLTLRVALKEDTDRVSEAIRQVASELAGEQPYASAILEPLEVLGVDQLAADAVVIAARIKTAPVKQWLVGREFNRRIKKRFQELGIELK